MSTNASAPHRRRWPWIVGFLLVLAAIAWWWFGMARGRDANAARRPGGPVVVVTAVAETRDVPVKLTANGTVTALQSVDLRSQVTSTVRDVHIREGQSVKQGDLLFTLDSRTEEANVKKALAQVEKDRADLATAERNLARNREIFEQKVRRYDDRHRVKSGITGWAQINGLRGRTSLSDRVELDNHYISNWSLSLDLKILFLTLGAVLMRSEE